MISVIVPVYNTEQYLHRCIDSILAQTYTDFELLLIDDGSTDSSGAICDEYALKDTRVRVFHKENGGVSSARNLGLDNAQGEWITFVDSDDIFVDSNAFAVFVNKDIDADLIVYSFLWNDDLIKCPCNNSLQDIFFSYHSIVIWGKIYKSSIIKLNQLYFNERIHLGEDQLWFTEYLKYTSTYLCNKDVLYGYNCIENNSLSLHNRKESWAEICYRVNLQIVAYKELENLFNITCYNAIIRLLYNSLNNLLNTLSLKTFKNILIGVRLLLTEELFVDLWNSTCIQKGRKMKLFDFFAQKRLYILAALYIKLIKKY